MVTPVSSVTRASLIEYASILADLDNMIAQYLSATPEEQLLQAKTLASLMRILRSIQHMELAASPELKNLMQAIIQRATPVENAVKNHLSNTAILSAMNTFINADNEGKTGAMVIQNAIDPSFWQTSGVAVQIRDSISDFAFYEYYRTADAVIAGTLGNLANRIEVSESFIEALNNIYQGVSWNPGEQYISKEGRLQNSSTIATYATGPNAGKPIEKKFQFYNTTTDSYSDSNQIKKELTAINGTTITCGVSDFNTGANNENPTYSFSNGDQVQYTCPGSPPAPLQSGTTYWVVGSGTTFGLSTTKGGSAMNIAATTSNKGMLERYSIVDTHANTITIPNHGFVNHQQVLYNSSYPFKGLESGLTYFVQNPTTNTFQLSSIDGGTIIELGFDPSVMSRTVNTFSDVSGVDSWYSHFTDTSNGPSVAIKMANGIAALRTMLDSNLLPSDSIEYTTAKQIIARWNTSFVDGGYQAVATSEATSRMWSDQTFQKLIQDGINGTSRLNEEHQLSLTRALSTYDFFTRSATNIVQRESDSVKEAASRITL